MGLYKSSTPKPVTSNLVTSTQLATSGTQSGSHHSSTRVLWVDDIRSAYGGGRQSTRRNGSEVQMGDGGARQLPAVHS